MRNLEENKVLILILTDIQSQFGIFLGDFLNKDVLSEVFSLIDLKLLEILSNIWSLWLFSNVVISLTCV